MAEVGTGHFVMVPVPEEHVLEVMALVTRLSAQQPAAEWPAKQWDQAALDRLVAEANERTRALLSFLAHRSRAGKEVTPREIAAALDLERGEVPGILGPLNRQFRKLHRVALFESRVRTVTSAEGRPEKRRTLTMSKETARMVRTAAEAAPALPPRAGRRGDAMTQPNGSTQRPRHNSAGDGDDGVVAVFEPHSVGLPPLGPYVREIWERRRFIQASARASIRGRRSTMVAGQAWAVLDPLFQAALYWLLFAILRGGQGGRGTAEGLTLLIGCLFLFNFTRIALAEGSRSVATGRALLMNSSLPRALLPLTTIYKGLLELIPSGVVFLVIYVAAGQSIGGGVVYLPLVLVIHTAINTGLALIFATISVYIRDVTNMLQYLTRVLLFVTPVLYPVEFLTRYPAVEKVLIVNPLFPVFAAYQEIILGGYPTVGQIALSLAWAVLLLTAGIYFFLSHERSFALHI